MHGIVPTEMLGDLLTVSTETKPFFCFRADHEICWCNFAADSCRWINTIQLAGRVSGCWCPRLPGLLWPRLANHIQQVTFYELQPEGHPQLHQASHLGLLSVMFSCVVFVWSLNIDRIFRCHLAYQVCLKGGSAWFKVRIAAQAR